MLLAQARYLDQLSNIIRDQPALFLLGILMAAVLTVSSCISSRVCLFALTLTMYMATLQRHIETPWYSLEMTRDMQLLSTYSRVLTIGCLIVLAISGLFRSVGTRRHLLSLPMVGLLLFEYLNCVKIASGGNVVLAINSFLVFTLIFLAIPVAIGKISQNIGDLNAVLLSVVGAGTLVILGTMYQLMVRPSAVFAGKSARLYATMGHPQKAGLLLALLIPIAMYLTIHWRRFALAKPALIGVSALSFVGIAASGSRTAILALIAGGGVLMRKKLSLGMIVAVVVLSCGVGILQQFSELQEASGRIISAGNTRADSWTRLINEFLENPAFGAHYSSSGTAESSFLGAAARMGIVGIFAVSALTFAIGKHMWRLNRARQALGPHAPLADLLIGGLEAMGIACVFDQYLFDTVTFFNMYLYVNLSLGSALIEFSKRETLAA